jgi:hypothetical protein
MAYNHGSAGNHGRKDLGLRHAFLEVFNSSLTELYRSGQPTRVKEKAGKLGQDFIRSIETECGSLVPR